jgi:hypothetical protein
VKSSTKYFYKYKNFDKSKIDWSKSIFAENRIFFASKSNFNDPFDCKFGFDFQARQRQIESYLSEMRSRDKGAQDYSIVEYALREFGYSSHSMKNFINHELEDSVSSYGILSLTRAPDDILMWSHYADSHQGYCLRFLDDKEDDFFGRALPVVYQLDYPILNPVVDDPITTVKKTLLTKAKHWKYEKEWRVIDELAGPGVKAFPADSLCGVIFGCRMNIEDQNMIREWCSARQSPVTFYQAKESDSHYSLEIVEV